MKQWEKSITNQEIFGKEKSSNYATITEIVKKDVNSW